MLQTTWPKLFSENNANLNITNIHEAEKAKLYQQIGQLTVEHDFLKKALEN